MFQNPDMIAQVNGVLVTNFLEIIKDINDKIKFVQASSREIFGEPTVTPQTEKTPKNPRNPYGAAKLYADNMVKIYRSNYKLFAASAILYNHESPFRTLSYVSKKICLSAAQIKLGLKKTFELGNIENLRDWGFAGDYVEAMWMMLQNKNPDDYIIASGQLHSVKDMCKIAFDYLGLNYKEHIIFNKNFYRPNENYPVVGNIDKAKNILGWKAKMTFSQLIHYMIDFEIEHIKKGTNS